MHGQELTPERWRITEEILLAAWDAAPETRDAVLQQRCAGDAALLAELRELVAAQIAADGWVAPAPASATTRTIGPFRLEQLIGRGGMGAVYLAHRADGQFDQKVAIKLIGLPFEIESFRERFRRERQILASLNHPNITRLLDGGITASGDLYLAMEYVDGVRIDEYAREQALTLEDRIRLFRDVCSAVHYAHQNLVVHRDIKPSNILVGKDGVAKLLDFGTAKLMADQETTQTGLGLMTAAYASPEQLRGEPATTLSDVFSLGVVLYELLCGSRPQGGALPKEIPQDVARICTKALDQDPTQRYSSVERFSDDLKRYLSDQPILARPAGAIYVTTKFLQRNKLSAAVAITAIVALCGVTAVAVYQRRLADERYRDMRSTTTSLLFELKDAIQDVPGSTKAQQILADRALKNLDKLAASSNSDPALQLELAEAYRQLGEVQGDPYAQNLGDPPGALKSLQKAQAVAAPRMRQYPSDEAWVREAGLIERTIAGIYLGMGSPREAILHAKAATAEFEKRVPLTHDSTFLAEAAATYGVYGDILGQHGVSSLGNATLAATEYKRARELNRMALEMSPGFVRAIRGTAVYGMKLGDLLALPDPEGALLEFEQAIAVIDRLPEKQGMLAPNRRFRGYLIRKLGSTLAELQQWQEARKSLKEALAYFESQVAADPKNVRAVVDLAAAYDQLARAEYLSGDYASARGLYENFVSQIDHLIESDPSNKAWPAAQAYGQFHTALTLHHLNLPQKAAGLAQQALSALKPITDRKDASALQLEYGAEAFASVEPASYRDPQRAVRLAKRRLESGDSNDLMALSLLAEAHRSAGEMSEASAAAKKVLALMAPSKGTRVARMRRDMEAVLGR